MMLTTQDAASFCGLTYISFLRLTRKCGIKPRLTVGCGSRAPMLWQTSDLEALRGSRDERTHQRRRVAEELAG